MKIQAESLSSAKLLIKWQLLRLLLLRLLWQALILFTKHHHLLAN